MNAKHAQETGLARPMRVVFVWDLVNIAGPELAQVGMCHALGTFKPKYCGRFCSSIDCSKKEHLVTKSKLAVLESRLDWLAKYIRNTFTIRSVKDDIVINKQALASYTDEKGELPDALTLKYSNTDLVILMTMV